MKRVNTSDTLSHGLRRGSRSMIADGLPKRSRQRGTGTFRLETRLSLVLLAVFSYGACTALPPAPPGPALVPSSASHNFGEVYVGVTATSGLIMWTNQSDRNVDVVGLVALPLDGVFNFSSPAQPFQSFVLRSAASSPAIRVTFTPNREASFTGTLSLQVSQPLDVRSVQLQGQGKHQIAQGDLAIGGGNITPGEYLDLGSVKVPGGVATFRRFELVNVSSQDISVTPAWSLGTQGFSVGDAAEPILVPRHGSTTVTVRFAPPSPGALHDAVTFVDSVNPNNRTGTTVRGVGTPPAPSPKVGE